MKVRYILTGDIWIAFKLVMNLCYGYLASFDKLLSPQLALFRDMRSVISLQDYIFP